MRAPNQASRATNIDIDLASDTAWTLQCDNGPARPIKVPGGGWNSDQQSPGIQVLRDVKDFVLYERKIIVPAIHDGQVVKLCFGAVAHGCEVFLDGQKMGEHHGPQVPFSIDLTAGVRTGREQTLQVKAYHRRHYLLPDQKQTAEVAVGWDYPEGADDATRAEAAAWSGWHGFSKVGYGIVRSVKLAVLPPIYIEDMFVRTSVSSKQFSCEVWIRNATGKERKFQLSSVLSSWNKRDWRYPAIPDATVAIPANSTFRTVVGPVVWNLGPESYWWPSIPFREDYLAQLHFLSLTISEGVNTWNRTSLRFGFVEHAEGPYYYTVNGVRYTGFSDGTAEGQTSDYDSYSSPAWLPPTGPGTGAQESWRRHMRVGINMNRLHCSPPTDYMMQAADETGFMLVPEAPIWGNGLSRYNPGFTPQTYHDLGRACRNHPSVARYSLTNEVRDWPSLWPSAIDDMREVDDIHPLVYELHNLGQGMVKGPKSGGHAWIMNHYTDIREQVGEGKGIRGMGEHFWESNNMGEFAVGCRTLRMNDWCYMAGWSWINYWPNFLQGMSNARHAWKPQDHRDRVDGVDGWGSPIVEFTRRSLHPYLVQDHGILNENPGSPRVLEDGAITWPYQLPSAIKGRMVERTVEIFNNGLLGNALSLAWSGHWDRPGGPIALTGGIIPCEIAPGFHTTRKIAFTVPDSGKDKRRLYLVMKSIKDGTTVFTEDGVYLDILATSPSTAARFVGTDQTTKGNWQGKYGADGYELENKESKLPGYAKLQWKKGALWMYEETTSDPRALAYFANPPTGSDRVAASRYADELVFTLDVGNAPRRLGIYYLDYDRKSRSQQVTIADPLTNATLDQREIASFADGVYQTWQIQGMVRVSIRRIAGDNATMSGLFLDPVK